MRKLRTWNRAFAVTVLTLSVVVAGPAVAASAKPASTQGAGPGRLILCNTAGLDGAVAEFPGRGGLSTTIVPNNLCNTFTLGGNTNEQVDFYVNNGTRYVASTIYNGSVGLTAQTIPGPNLVAFPG
ncbi:hypothetical protein [Actinoplanes sp. NBRC 103695]|uniref:hypothetical protein n=1 Tax=Actinoplanes sp. NBRC 103695 TaxID=3032202 RepID=UPI0024A04EB0|nr:hypothetical protein [Actinoplanes sp. NBRC 103695]GLZ02341.1 hypothetical protein Acsp02_95920 [Actinoplanes sp. NBRC 103695]